MKKLMNTILIIIALGAFAGCGESTFTGANGSAAGSPDYRDPVTPYVDRTSPSRTATENHCQDINVGERVFLGDLKSTFDQRPFKQILEDYGVCTNAGNGFQRYTGFGQYEVNGGTNQCSWWSRHGMKVYVNFVRGYRQAAVVTIDATGDGWPVSGQTGFPTARMQFRNGMIDCNQKDLTINVEVKKNVNGRLQTVGLLKITAPKETGNKYSSTFRGTVSYNGTMISKGLFYVTQ